MCFGQPRTLLNQSHFSVIVMCLCVIALLCPFEVCRLSELIEETLAEERAVKSSEPGAAVSDSTTVPAVDKLNEAAINEDGIEEESK